MRGSRTAAVVLSRFAGECGSGSEEIEMEGFDSETSLEKSDNAPATEYNTDIDTGTALALGLSGE